jgi:hypothetical protein
VNYLTNVADASAAAAKLTLLLNETASTPLLPSSCIGDAAAASEDPQPFFFDYNYPACSNLTLYLSLSVYGVVGS